MKKIIYLAIGFLFIACGTKEQVKTESDISDISVKEFTKFKVLDSENIENQTIWSSLDTEMVDFPETEYERLKPYILEKNILELHKSRVQGIFTYEKLVKFYLYRIKKYDRNNELSLNAVIRINPNIIAEAKQKDQEFFNKRLKPLIFGMPILLKDNINTKNMPTTAGAVALKDNYTKDAFIVQRLKQEGALILGKANLSEWAYFFCGDCPSGYSAIGGQTLNPYGRKTIDTGGSSSGSGVSVAANFAVAAVGTETAGSILSPASQNSVVGLKPTIGLLSRSGIVPISSTLDTPGPMTKNVIDNAILLATLFGYDASDPKSKNPKWTKHYYFTDIKSGNVSLKGKRFGAFTRLLKDTLYIEAINILKQQGAIIVEIEEEKINLPKFINLLNLDMQKDLPAYFENYASKELSYTSVQDIIDFNKKDSLKTMPYGQKLFYGIVNDKANKKELKDLKKVLYDNGKSYFDIPMKEHNLDGVLSINNYHAAFAAVAEYPALTVPMGYTNKGEPKGLTFIGKPFTEKNLLEFAYVYEQASKKRKAPKNYN
ncbi:Putative amidase AmiD [Kordia antarctica]|uniref:Amidase AmiD n=1 Tax=Kordia antarctica TaxID=1218801 RepID=A0A7L4ZQC1_9FLAO|nr:amidase family protein [Kordia antarctica]QHI38822.1 Putative amidase AmiD [Kordia antarctica]